MYRKDRKKGGGGLLAYFSSALPFKKRALPKTYKTLEAIAVEVKIGSNDDDLQAPKTEKEGKRVQPPGS